MINFRMLKLSDFTLWVAVGLLILVGAMMILTTTYSMQVRSEENPFSYFKKQMVSLFMALIAMIVLMYLDYDNLNAAAIPIYVITLLMLGLVQIKGFTILGAQRWISVGPVSFQPAELAKLSVIIAFAFYLKDRVGKINNLFSLIPAGLIVGLPFLLVFRQPDLGTSLVILAISFGMLVWAKASLGLILMLFTPIVTIFLSGNIYILILYLIVLFAVIVSLKIKWLDAFVIMAGNVASSYIFKIILGSLKEYQRLRLLAFMDPNIDPRGAGYHSLQAKIAVGSGKFFGRGLFHGTQTQLQFIPQQFSDFIFSAVGEELGFIGALFVITLFILVIWRALSIAGEARTTFGSLLASGIAVMFMFHLLVNVGMTLGLLPVVGIPLPFMSFGGTSLLMNLSAIGILQSISMRRSKLIF